MSGEPAGATPAAHAGARERPAAATRALDALRGALAVHAEAAAVISITLLAAALRLWDLGDVPLGLHGDEALTGIDARRILREGWIGPYVTSALGQPTGPLYFEALFLKVLPDTTFTVRLPMALLGAATIPLCYAAFSAMFERRAGVFAAALLAIMTWHLHLSRTGFMVTSWPFMQVAVLWAVFTALRTRDAAAFALAGALAGLGVYTYNAYLLFLPALAVALAWTWLREAERQARRRLAAHAAIFAATAFAVSVPMIAYIARNFETYRYHQEVVGVTYSDEWKQGGALDRIDILWDRAYEWGRGLALGGRPDLGDGLATHGHAVVDAVTLALAAGGLLVALRFWRRPEYATLLACVALLPLGALLTTLDGLYRRTFGLAPVIAALAALPLAWIWGRLGDAPSPARHVLRGAIVLVIAAGGARGVVSYFGDVQDTAAMKFVYPYQMEAASHYIDGLPPGTYVYFYSDRWSIDYETRQFLAPDAAGMDRSTEFRFGVDASAPLDLSADRSVDVAFVFLGPYLDRLEDVTIRYPGGRVTEESLGEEVLYRAYFLPGEAAVRR